MNITFLMGNGFDIGVGLESKFEQFFPTYIDKSKNKSEDLKQLAIDIEIDCKKNGYYKTWADFEKALGEYTANFTPETKQKFIDQVKDFEKEFVKYLQEQENGLSFEEKDEISTIMIDALIQYYSVGNLAPESSSAIANVYSKHSDESHIYNFINFNYTDTLEHCLETISQKTVTIRKYRDTNKTDKIGEIIHVHGKKYAHPIIGVNDVSQIVNVELANDPRFAKKIVKPTLNKCLRLENDKNATSIINKSTILCIYGMSLGVTDKKWWNLILSWLAGSSERHLVIFNYDTNYSSSTQFDWIEKEDEIIDTLSQYSNSVDVENLVPRIHIAIHKNIFQIDLRKEAVRERGLAKVMLDAQMAADIVRKEQISKAVEEAMKMTTA